MSTAMGIAAVTAALKNMLNKGITEAGLGDVLGGDITISSLPPERVNITGPQDPNQLNIFFYQATFNAGWRNTSLPSRSDMGDRTANPPLALDLHYLVSAYGSQDYYPEILLGHAAQVFHEYPVLPRAFIEKALTPVTGLPKELLASGLSSQMEQVTITPEMLDAEQMSRFWSALQAHYRPTAGYKVGVVLIEASRPRRAALPVTALSLAIAPFPNIQIDTATLDTGNVLTIKGSNLRGTDTRVELGGVEFVPATADISPTQIILTLPNPLPIGFYAGAKGIQVVQEIAMGVPPTPRPVYRSNMVAVVLRPTIAVAVVGAALKIDFTPNIGRSQRLEVLLSEYNPPANRQARVYSFPGPPANGITDPATPDVATVTVPLKSVLTGSYLVRVQVDGAESPLGMTAGVYATPKVDIP